MAGPQDGMTGIDTPNETRRAPGYAAGVITGFCAAATILLLYVAWRMYTSREQSK
jgi:hypothetical protein